MHDHVQKHLVLCPGICKSASCHSCQWGLLQANIWKIYCLETVASKIANELRQKRYLNLHGQGRHIPRGGTGFEHTGNA